MTWGIFRIFITALTLTTGASAQTTLTIATVDNRDMERMQRLSDVFLAENPGVELEWVVLDETPCANALLRISRRIPVGSTL